MIYLNWFVLIICFWIWCVSIKKLTFNDSGFDAPLDLKDKLRANKFKFLLNILFICIIAFLEIIYVQQFYYTVFVIFSDLYTLIYSYYYYYSKKNIQKDKYYVSPGAILTFNFLQMLNFALICFESVLQILKK